MAIFYMTTNIIGRSSGRSAIGAAAYRRSAKMRSVAHAAYQRGEKIYGKGDRITHDYRSKRGVVHSEIMLPEGAPLEFMDSETLWNAVEVSETRKNSQLAREIIVALPREFDLDEQIEAMREYVQENFADKGMIADFSIHNNDTANPHAHIMLTTRHVSRDGFGNKNRDWNKKEFLLSYREAWANIINDRLVRKGLDIRIDHRSYKEQGLDRLPYIHLGHEASALEKKGIQTERGDYNREIARRNDERAVKVQNIDQQQDDATPNKLSALKKWGGSVERDALMAAKRNMREIEEQLEVEKAAQITEKLQQHADREEAEKIEKHMRELQENYIAIDSEIYTLTDGRDMANYRLPSLNCRAKNIDEHTKNIESIQNGRTTLRRQRKKAHLWQIQLKRDLDGKIALVEDELCTARAHFKVDYGISPEQAPEEIKRIDEKIKMYTADLKKAEQIPELSRKLKEIEKEYHKQKIRLQTLPDRDRIERRLQRLKKPPQSDLERLQYERINRRLNMTVDESAEIIREMERKQAQEIRDLSARSLDELVRTRELKREQNRNQNRTIGRSR